MTRSAVLTTPAGGDPFARVAGMTVLLRQLLSLQDAGIEEVELPEELLRQVRGDSRLQLRLAPSPPFPLPAERGGGREMGLLTARAGLVWHRLLPRRLLQQGYHGDLERAPLAPDEFLLPVRDAASAKDAERLLLGSLLKATDGLISRLINRPISLAVTRRLLDTGLTPNQMTWIAALFGFAGIGVVLWGGGDWLLAGALLYQAQSVLDGCDGEISRLKYIRSRLGEWLDQVLDDVVNVGFFAAAGWALHRAGSSLALPVTILGTTLHLAYQAALYTALVTRGGGSGSIASIRWRAQPGPEHRTPAARSPVLLKVAPLVETLGRRDFFVFLYLPAAALQMTEVALVWAGVIFAISGIGTVTQWVVWGGPRPASSAT